MCQQDAEFAVHMGLGGEGLNFNVDQEVKG